MDSELVAATRMDLTLLLLAAFLAHAVCNASDVDPRCKRTIVRKEFRDMSKKEWDEFAEALLSLQRLPSPNRQETNQTEWDYWTKIHIDNMMVAHNSPLFFPWHRAYILALEQRLQKINHDITLPYWDWTLDWQAPLRSPIFSPAYRLDVNLGGDCRYRRSQFSPHCLLREYEPDNFPNYYSPQSLVRVMLGDSNYDSFRELIEMVPHAIPHTTLGGRRGDMAGMNSPNDPIFFVHHSMVDYIWWLWQGLSPGQATAYRGDPEQVLRPFGLKVKDVQNIGRYCVTYQPPQLNPALSPSGLRASSNRTTGALATRVARKLRSVRAVDGPRVWQLSRQWLHMYHVTRAKLQRIVDRFNRLAGRPRSTIVRVI